MNGVFYIFNSSPSNHVKITALKIKYTHLLESEWQKVKNSKSLLKLNILPKLNRRIKKYTSFVTATCFSYLTRQEGVVRPKKT